MIQKFKEFFDKIEEAAKNPLPITWTKSETEWTGEFSLQENIYEIKIARPNPDFNFYYFKFSANGQYKMISDPTSVFRVVPTIDRAANEFLTEVQPDAMFFFALDKSEARRMMYDRFCLNFVNMNKQYRYETREFMEYQCFILYTESCDTERLQSVIGEFSLAWMVSNRNLF